MKKNRDKNIVLLGSTGSIGKQTLNVCRRLNLKVKALACHKNINLLYQQIQEFQPQQVVVVDQKAAQILRERLKNEDNSKYENGNLNKIEVLTGTQGLMQVAQLPCDCLVMAIIGFAALKPLTAAIKSGQKIAMANKETIVALGDFIMDMTKRYQAEILPVDSEPSAIWQCLSANVNPIEKIILTASGGPFKDVDKSKFAEITVAEALNHPVWAMGNKITVDSATMMNKGLEMIEISHLFQVEAEQIEIIVQPESIIHSMVEFTDGAILAQMGLPDMELPIQYAITYERRCPMPDKPRINFAELGRLNFSKPDFDKFPSLKLAYYAKKQAGAMPAVLNAADEIAVFSFIHEQIRFDQIPRIIEQTLEHFVNHDFHHIRNMEDILAADCWAREESKHLIQKLSYHKIND